jgi:hypothetical protein
VSAVTGCHLYFAHRVTFLPCADIDIVARHWQTGCIAEPTSNFESVMRRPPPTDREAGLALEPALTLSSAATQAFGHYRRHSQQLRGLDLQHRGELGNDLQPR